MMLLKEYNQKLLGKSNEFTLTICDVTFTLRVQSSMMLCKHHVIDTSVEGSRMFTTVFISDLATYIANVVNSVGYKMTITKENHVTSKEILNQLLELTNECKAAS